MAWDDISEKLLQDIQEIINNELDKVEEEEKAKEDEKEVEEASSCSKDTEEIEEAISIPPAGVASPEPCSAIGARQLPEPAKHADVIADTDPLNSTKTYRLLVQRTNGRPEFIPPIELPAAPSLESLLDIVSGLPDAEVLVKAVSEVMQLPSDEPQFRGNDKELTEEVIQEVSPPNAKIEKWIKDNKQRFVDQYGAEKGKEVLYAKAWKMHNEQESLENYFQQVASLVENFVDEDGVENELDLMAANNYPKEWNGKDINGLMRKLETDALKLGNQDLRETIKSLMPRIKQSVLATWRRP